MWSIESHTFTAAWGEFSPTLEDVKALIGLPVSEEVKTIKLHEDNEKVAMDEARKKKLEALNKALSDSTSSNKSTYAHGGDTLSLARGEEAT